MTLKENRPKIDVSWNSEEYSINVEVNIPTQMQSWNTEKIIFKKLKKKEFVSVQKM